MPTRLLQQLILIVAVSLGVVAVPTWAQPYPSRPVRMVLPSGTGNVLDVLGRAVASKLNERQGWTMIVENKPGGDFSVGTMYVLQAPADGYTLFVANGGQTILPFTKKDLPYVMLRDLTPLTRIASVPLMLAINPSVPATTLQELAAYSKANPGKLNFGTTGSGGTASLAGSFLKRAVGLDMVEIPYKDAGSTVTDLLGGRLHTSINSIGTFLPHVREGKLRAIVTLGSSRSPMTPEVPSAAEATGNAELDVDSWFGMMVRAGTPPDIVDRLQREIAAIMQLPDIRELTLKSGLVPISESAEQFRSKIQADLNRWEKVIAEMPVKTN